MFGNNRVLGSPSVLVVTCSTLLCGTQHALADGGTIVGKINFEGKMARKESKKKTASIPVLMFIVPK